ncbi:MAG: glycosyltransferase [Janthinobacterium lividum]
MKQAGQTICLCMIVKNESQVISRCLRSVLPLLDAWVVVDTGSTDGTQQRVTNELGHLPGELLERPWIDFAQNRSESIALASSWADYLLIIDADEFLEFASDFQLPQLSADAYDLELLSGAVTYYKTQLVRCALRWRYEGVVHEHIVTDAQPTRERLPGIRTIRILDGARARDPLTFRKDALLLEGALLQDPQNARHMFYLAQSYADAGELELAIDRYRKRVTMGGWHEEVWSALYQIARLREMQELDWPIVLSAYLDAFSYRPDRAEPLFRIGIHYQGRQEYAAAYLFLAQAVQIPFPATDILFVERDVYHFYLPLEFSVACFYVGRHAEAVDVANQLLAGGSLTEERQQQVTRNRQFSLDVLATATQQ